MRSRMTFAQMSLMGLALSIASVGAAQTTSSGLSIAGEWKRVERHCEDGSVPSDRASDSMRMKLSEGRMETTAQFGSCTATKRYDLQMFDMTLVITSHSEHDTCGEVSSPATVEFWETLPNSSLDQLYVRTEMGSRGGSCPGQRLIAEFARIAP